MLTKNKKSRIVLYGLLNAAPTDQRYYLNALPFSARYYSQGQVKNTSLTELASNSALKPSYIAVPHAQLNHFIQQTHNTYSAILTNKRYVLFKATFKGCPFFMNTPLYKIRMLVVEDNIGLAENIFEFFDQSHYMLDFASDGLTALHLLATNQYDIVVLDVMLPGVNGFEICQRIRHDLHCSTPIILVTAKDQINDKETGFKAGADDYLVKPFNLVELRLRVQALTRRGRQFDHTLSLDNLRYDPDTFNLYIDRVLVSTLTGFSARIFELLLRAYPRPVNYEQLIEQVWAGKPTEYNTIRTHVSALRKQLQETTDVIAIKTLHGRGYLLERNT